MPYSSSIAKMTPRHYKILDYSIAGLTRSQIAKELGMSFAQVGIIINSPSFQHQFAIRRQKTETTQDEQCATNIDEVKEVLQQSAKSAADKLISGITSTDEKIALKSAVEILDRTGYPKEQKMTGDASANTQILINAVDLTTLKESLDMDSSKPIDSKITEEGATTPPASGL